MRRHLVLSFAFAATVGLTGCAGTWDKISSRRFRENPYQALFDNRDPLTVMQSSQEGDERAAMMRKLKEPALAGRDPQDQEEAMRLLTEAAIGDPSPVVRVAAVDALGRFRDPRAVKSLTAAYYQASGTPQQPATGSPFQLASGGRDLGTVDKSSLTGPTGFAPEVASVIRGRAVNALANTGSAEAIPVLTEVATGAEKTGGTDRDTRLAAVRGLKQLRAPESVLALSKVLTLEKTRDPALAGRAHEGLVSLTGQSIPDDPQRWDMLIRSGEATVTSPPNFIQQAGAMVFGN